MDKFEDFMLKTEVQIRQLHDELDAQTLVIAWLMTELDRVAPDAEPPSRHFLLGQSLNLTDDPKFSEYVALFDALSQHYARFASLRRRPRQTR